MRQALYGFLLLTVQFLSGCQDTTTITTYTTEPDITDCDYNFIAEYGSELVIQDIEIPYSEIRSNSNNFICPCKETDEQALILTNSQLKTHQIIMTFDAIYPLEFMDILNYEGSDADGVESISIELSINGVSFNRIISNQALNQNTNRIELNNQMAKAVKIVLPDTDASVGIQDIAFKLGEGYIVREETELTAKFLRTSGWTGSDGIFTFDLNNGGDRIGVSHETTAFIFSDTFIGSVNPDNLVRISPKMINNSFGYLNHSDQSLSFAYRDNDGTYESVLLPDSYIGSRARNLLDQDGLTISYHPDGRLTNINEGTMWLSDQTDSELVIDLKKEIAVPSIFIWNYNANPLYGVKEFDLYASLNGSDYSLLGQYQMEQASGSALEPYTLDIIFNENITRYLKLVITDTYNDEFVGLGKIMLFGLDGSPLFGEISASNEIETLTKNEETARLWLQDGVVIDDKVYLFPILVKDYLTYFQVHSVGMIEMNIIADRFDYEHATYLSTPLMTKTADGGTVFFGAGVMDHRETDGYIYVYGYKDGNGRQLVVARATEEQFKNFNEWQYFDGEDWTHNINQVAGLISHVSAELSVTYMETGQYAGKFMLVVMKDTTSGTVAYAIGDSPVGPFSDYVTVFNTIEDTYLNGAFTYNAKMHPNLSTEDRIIISYNVNTTNFQALADARIYYPRFISMTEIRKDEE